MPGQITEVTEVTSEETVVDTPAPEPTSIQTSEPQYEPLTSRPEPLSESSTPDEFQYRYVPPQQQPQNPEVLIIDEDELSVNGERKALTMLSKPNVSY